MTVRRRSSQASVGLLVLGLHLAGVLAWWTAEQHGLRTVHSNTRLPAIAVWLPALAAPHTQQTEPAKRKQRVAAPGESAQRDSGTSESKRAADTPPAPASGSGIYVPAETPGSIEAQTTTPTAPALNLNLSRKSITSVAPPSFAEQSPFRGRLPATVERQIATAAAETGPWTEERIDNDHIRFRRGNTCVTLQRPRMASLDPFDPAMARIPWRTSGAETCQ